MVMGDATASSACTFIRNRPSAATAYCARELTPIVKMFAPTAGRVDNSATGAPASTVRVFAATRIGTAVNRLSGSMYVDVYRVPGRHGASVDRSRRPSIPAIYLQRPGTPERRSHSALIRRPNVFATAFASPSLNEVNDLGGVEHDIDAIQLLIVPIVWCGLRVLSSARKPESPVPE